MKNFVARFIRNQSGTTAIEYGLIAALIGVALIGVARALDAKIATTFSTAVTELAKGGDRTP